MKELEQYRQEIDRLDEEITRLFLRRMEITGKVGQYKLAHAMPVMDAARERQLLAAKAALVADPKRGEDVRELFQSIMAISRKRQQEMIDIRSHRPRGGRRNIVLIGMPGSGKSCVGACLARRLGWPLMETDAMIVEEKGRSIPEIFAQEGEEAFRREESAAARRAASVDGAVISTGGGMILRRENMEALSATGTVFFLNRDPEEIAREELAGRPLLAGGRERVFQLYEQRIHLYRGYAQHIIPSSTVEKMADAILSIAEGKEAAS